MKIVNKKGKLPILKFRNSYIFISNGTDQFNKIFKGGEKCVMFADVLHAKNAASLLKTEFVVDAKKSRVNVLAKKTKINNAAIR